ncbi:hypothetical protein [Streptobacillus ratti]|uniref:hypothetical protein n=1 Tax=Streptobacillus ratti TaxID=1720557 RepID=UPI0009331570|nr:hypothetical protein [Streptobacillus ratti]
MKKLLLALSIISISVSASNISGPRYRLEMAVGAMNLRDKKIFRSPKVVSSSISVFPEWKADINEKFDITFGPKGTLNVAFNINAQTTVRSSVILGGEIDFNYKVKENLKIYSSIEAGLGVGFQGPIITGDPHIQGELTSISKLGLGIKVNEKFNFALYTGVIKGVLGVEAGYTF